MKKKKITAFALILSLGALTGCGEDHVHVYSYTTEPATCAAEGVERGVCTICGEETERSLPIDKSAHTYGGEWEITPPTEALEGRAKKQCIHGDGTFEVTLPALTESGAGYTSTTVVENATALTEGIREYTLSTQAGDVTVRGVIPARGVSTVRDGVEAAVISKNKIFKGSGELGYSRVSPNPLLSEPYNPTAFRYGYGEDCTYSYDEGDELERWYSLDEEGKIFGILLTDGNPSEENFPEYMDGARLYLTYTGLAFNGAENLLSGLYGIARLNGNGDFTEEKEGDVYRFEFGRIVSNSQSVSLFAKIRAEFTLTAECALKNLSVVSSIYINQTPASGGEGFITWKEENGIATVLEKEGDRIIDEIHLTQTTLSEAAAAGEAALVNPYSKDKLFFSSFELYDGGFPVEENEPIEARADTALILSLEESAPNTANVSFDPIQVYLVRADGTETLLSYDTHTDSEIGITGFYDGFGSFILRSRIAGLVKIKIASRFVTKYVTLNVKRAAPSVLVPTVYAYGDTGYTWSPAMSTQGTATVYVGQPLYFKCTPSQEEAEFAETSFTASITTTTDKAELTSGGPDGAECFIARAAGTYTVRMRTNAPGSNAACSLKITVEEAPKLSEMLTGTYTAMAQYPRGTVKVTFRTSSGKGTATIENAEGSTEVINFTFTQSALGAAITSQHGSGASLGYVLTVNEAYRLVLTHPTGFGDEEKIILNKLSEN